LTYVADMLYVYTVLYVCTVGGQEPHATHPPYI